MLEGKVKVKNKSFIYDLQGVDNSTTLSLRISSKNYNAINYMDNKDCIDTNKALWERRFDVNLSKVVVETAVATVNGKKVKADVNADFFCKLGALIRYAKTNCLKRYEEGFTGLSLASGEFEMQVQTKYIIPYPCDGGRTLAEVTLLYDSIVALHIETDELVIDLEETGSETLLFPAIKDGWRSGIAFNKAYLGFDLLPQEVTKVASNRGMYTCIEDIIKAHPDKEFSWLLKKDYIIVNDNNLEEICKYIMEWQGYVYYDTETTGLNINFKSRLGQADQLVGIVLSVKYGESFYFPVQMKSIPNLCNGDHWYFMEHYMRPILEGKNLVAHNMSFDWKVAYIYDINANIVHDTMALIKLTIGAEELNYPMGLKENTKILLKRDSLELSDLIVDGSWGESDDIKFWDLPAELVRLYACADTDNTNGLLGYAMQADLLNKYNATKVYEIEIAFSLAVAYQEFYGHRIDIEKLNEVRAEIEKNQQKCMAEMVKIAGHEFNPNSPRDLIQIMYHELGIPTQISRKTGNPTTDKETLKKLSEITDAEDNTKYPFCKWLQEYRDNEGVRKIVDKFPEHVTEDGYAFSAVMQYGTTTGRVSINKPNYQSYNDPIKKNIIPRPGFWMFDTDYSSVEYRVLGNMVGNKRIMESFVDPDFDYHAYQAARMYGVPYSAVTKKMRKAAKGINFGLPYGMGDESLGIRVFGEASSENTRKAGALRNAYFKGQEDIRDWFEYHRDKGVNEGYTETFFGRRRYYHRSKFSPNAIRRQAGNQVIQGTAADIYKTAVGRVFKRICKEGLLGKVLLTGFIHDELLGEVSNDINPAVWLKILREEFEVKVTNQDGSSWCPLYMGFGYGMSWYEAKSVELPIKLQWEIVDNYGETGFPNWNGDARTFCDGIPDMLHEFEVRDIGKQMNEPDAQGKEIKPTLNNQILDCLKLDAKNYEEGVSDYITSSGDFVMIQADNMEMSDYLNLVHDGICEYLDKKYHIQDLYTDENGKFTDSFVPEKSDTQVAIDQFCKLHKQDRGIINLLSIEEFTESEINTDNISYYYEDDEDMDSEEKRQRIIDTRVDTLGLYLDIENKRIILRMLPKSFMDLIQSKVNRDGEGYKIRFKDCDAGKLYDCEAWLKSEDVNFIQQIYLTYFNALARSK